MFKVCIIDTEDGSEIEQKLTDMKKEGYDLINLQPHEMKNSYDCSINIKEAMMRRKSGRSPSVQINKSYLCIFEKKIII